MVMRWLDKFPEFRDQYTRARDLLTEYWANEIVDIADEDDADVNRSRLRVDTRKWLMARMAPKKYGDRIQADSVVDVRISLAELVNTSYAPDLPALPPPKVIDHEE